MRHGQQLVNALLQVYNNTAPSEPEDSNARWFLEEFSLFSQAKRLRLRGALDFEQHQ